MLLFNLKLEFIGKFNLGWREVFKFLFHSESQLSRATGSEHVVKSTHRGRHREISVS